MKVYAAFSQIDITPEYPVSLIGRYREKPSQGVLHRLFAQILLFQRDEEIFCLAAIDSLSLNVPLASIVRSKIADVLGTEVSHVMLNFSHTHSAPDPTPLGVNGEKYFSFLCTQLQSCAETAKLGLRPCKVGWTLGHANIGENRRAGCTITDNRLGGLMVAYADTGKPIALVVRISAHPNILPGENLNISSDFVGAAREELQSYYGSPVMILQGAAGNIRARGTNQVGEGSEEVFTSIAGMLVEDVKKLHFVLGEVEDIRMFSEKMDCFSDLPTLEEAEKIAQKTGAQGWRDAVAASREKGIVTQEFQIEANFLKLNGGCFCGVPSEIFCEIALEVQRYTGNPFFFLNGYTNGYTGYLPSQEEWHKGGYEMELSYLFDYMYTERLAHYCPETADRLVELAAEGWQRMNGE